MRYIFGDLHANIDEFLKLQKILQIQAKDTCIFVGDYLGKQPHTIEILQALRDLQQRCTCVLLKGNHDYVWERYLLHKETFRKDFLLHHGDVKTLEEFSENPKFLLETDNIETISGFLSEYLELLPLMQDYYIAGEFFATHAGVAEDNLNQEPLMFEEKDYFLRPEKMQLEKRYLGRYTVVAGHTFLDVAPTFKKGYINIDLGAGYGKYLGALCVEQSLVVRSDGEVFSINI
jgi:serine/threonine protein phosphatase 1